jgi:hypothetical protein
MTDLHRRDLFGRQGGCCYLNAAMDDGPSARYCTAVSRLSAGCSAFELRRNERFGIPNFRSNGIPS